MVVDASEFENSAGSELGGAVHLVDMKTHASTSDHNSDSTTRGQVAKIRQDKVNSAYFKKAKWLGHVVHGSLPDEQGPVERELHEYGHNGRVLGPSLEFTGADPATSVFCATSPRFNSHGSILSTTTWTSSKLAPCSRKN